MRSIPLTQGREAWVDDEDYPVLSRWKWQVSADGYVVHSTHIQGKCVKILMHRFLISPAKHQVVDHIDGDRKNNQRSNLRIASRSENKQNSRHIVTLSGFKGVSHDKTGYTARIEREGDDYHLGHFATAIEAAAAYDKKALEIYGPDAATNEKIFLSYIEKLQSLK